MRTKANKARATHGHAQAGHVSREYSIWLSIKDRCLNPESRAFADYGGRGITVCAAWQDSFEAFLRDMGPRPSPGHSVERKDGGGPYAPWNCAWATRREQNANRSNAVRVTYRGEEMWLPDACEAAGLSYKTVRWRMDAGWPESDLFLPAMPGKRTVRA